MDHSWAAQQLKKFADTIDIFSYLMQVKDKNLAEAERKVGQGKWALHDELVSSEPVMRDLMNAAQRGLGDYTGGILHLDTGSRLEANWSPGYWPNIVRPPAIRAFGIHSMRAEARARMRPDSPELVGDQFHKWVWDAATPLWDAGNRQEAVLAAARSVNARLQQKVGRRDVAESSLCREAFTLKPPEPTRSRLRFPGDRTSDTWRSRQQGAMDLGAGCFEGIRNPATHEHELDLSEQVAMEQLAALSLLARWIDECDVESISTEAGQVGTGTGV